MFDDTQAITVISWEITHLKLEANRVKIRSRLTFNAQQVEKMLVLDFLSCETYDRREGR